MQFRVTYFIGWEDLVTFLEDYFVFCGLAEILSVGYIQIIIIKKRHNKKNKSKELSSAVRGLVMY